MPTQNPSPAAPVTMVMLPERRFAIRRSGVFFVFISLVPFVSFMALGNFQIPLPIRSFNDIWIFVLYGVCFLLFPAALWLLWYLWQLSTATLELHQTGVRYQTPLFTIYTSWENIERIGASSSGGESFLLREPAVLEHASRFAKPIPARDAIPLSLFGQTYGVDRLAEAIRVWAPHLIRPCAKGSHEV